MTQRREEMDQLKRQSDEGFLRKARATLQSIEEIDGIDFLEMVKPPTDGTTIKGITEKKHPRGKQEVVVTWLKQLVQKYDIKGNYFITFFDYQLMTWTRVKLHDDLSWVDELWRRAGFHNGLCFMSEDKKTYLEMYMVGKDRATVVAMYSKS
jgi:hypothetical protein